MRDKFVTTDEDEQTGQETTDRSAVFYMKEQDMKDLIFVIEAFAALPKSRFMKVTERLAKLHSQFKSALKYPE